MPVSCMQQVLLVVVVALSGGMTIGMCSYAFGSYVQPLTDEFGWSRVQINVAMTVNFVVYSLMGPVVGWSLDKHGARLTATCGLAFGAVGFTVLATAKTLPVFYLAYAITGIGFPCVTMPSAKIIGAWFGPKRGRMMGLVGAGNNFGGLIAVNISSILARTPGFGWQYAAATFALISTTLMVAYWVVVRNSPPPDAGEDSSSHAPSTAAAATAGSDADHDGAAEEERTGLLAPAEAEEEDEDGGGGGEKDEETLYGKDQQQQRHQLSGSTALSEEQARQKKVAASAVAELPESLEFGEAVKLRVFWTTTGGILSAMWTYPAVLEQLQPALLAEGLDPTEAVSLVSAVATCGICGKLGSGLLSEKLTARYTMCVLLLLQILAMVLFLIGSPNRLAIWVGFLFYGVGFGGIGAMLGLLVIDTFGLKHFGKINGMIQLGVAVPSITAPILGGAVFDATGTYRLHFAITIPVFTLSMLLLAAGKPAVASQEAKASAKKAKP